jgi:uncharacterized phage protein gp47/JayE
MPFARPTLKTLRERMEAALAAELAIGAILPQSTLAAVAAAEAGNSHLVLAELDNLSHQFLPSKQTESAELDRMAELKQVPRKQAVGATGLVHFTGVGTTLVPGGTILVRADGITYQTNVDTNLVAGAKDIAVTGIVPDGIHGGLTNASIGTPLTVQTPIVNINSATVVADNGSGGGLTNGFDLESDEDLLNRVLEAWKNPPQGGSVGDYLIWAKQVPGVTRAWVITPFPDLNDVGVGFVLDHQTPTIFPDAPKIAEMQAYLEDPIRKPVTSHPVAFAPIALDLDYTVTDLSPDTPAVRDSVEAAIADLCLKTAQVGVVMPLSKIRQAISNAPGVDDFVLTIPAADIVPAAGELIVPGTATFV